MANFPAFEYKEAINLFSGETGSVTGTPEHVGRYRHYIVEIVATGGTVSGVIEVLSGYGSSGDFKNMSPQHCRNVDTDAAVSGSTGLTLSTAGIYKLLVNSDFVEWLQVDLTHTNGTFTANLYCKEG